MTTTPPREWARTPPAPLYGPKYDDYEPYEIRKSTRLSKKQANRSNRTPSPGRGAPEPVPAASYPSSSRASHSVSHTLSPPPSNQPMSRKKFVDGSSLEDVFLTAADEEGAMGGAMNMANGRPGLLTHELLPTPAKTPRKRQPQPKGMGATARVLFPTLPNNVEEAMPMPKKGRKGRKANGFSLGGLANEDDDNNGGAKIQIYTDSKDRVPELDPSEDNPFYVSNESGSADLSKQKSAGKAKAARSTETRTPRRDDGIVYVFRGKKIFRKFEDMDSSSDEGQDSDGFNDLDARRGSSSSGRAFTRSSLKPRLLFPSEEQLREREERSKRKTDDKETTTSDAEDGASASKSTTDQEVSDSPPEPMVAAATSPATSPATTRVTRSATRKPTAEQTPSVSDVVPTTPGSSADAMKTSPFDIWRRSKPRRGGSPRGKKRQGSPNMRPTRSVSKRTRSGAV